MPDGQRAGDTVREFNRTRRECICPHDVRPLGRLHGVNMGKATVRLSTTPGCPEHDQCHRWTAENRRKYAATRPWVTKSGPYCPIHKTRDCP